MEIPVISQYSQKLYLLNMLCSQGSSVAQLQQVTRLLYALQVRCGFLTLDLERSTEGLLKWLSRYVYLAESVSFSPLTLFVL